MQLSDRRGGGVVILACDGLDWGVGGASVCEGVGGGGGGHVELPMQPSDCRGGVVIRDCWAVGGNNLLIRWVTLQGWFRCRVCQGVIIW